MLKINIDNVELKIFFEVSKGQKTPLAAKSKLEDQKGTLRKLVLRFRAGAK